MYVCLPVSIGKLGEHRIKLTAFARGIPLSIRRSAIMERRQKEWLIDDPPQKVWALTLRGDRDCDFTEENIILQKSLRLP